MTPVAKPLSLQDDVKSLARLFIMSFPETGHTESSAEEYLRWKYKTRPDCSIMMFEDEEPVGFYGVLPRLYASPEGPVRVGLVTDVLTHPKARGRGVFTAAGTAAVKRASLCGLNALLGFPIRREVMPGHERVGFRIVGQQRVYLRPVLPDLMNSPSGHPGVRGAPPAERLLRGEHPLSVTNCLGAGSFHDSLPQEMRLQASQSFLDWRLARPGCRYEVVSLSNDSESFAISTGTKMKGFKVMALLTLRASNPQARGHLLKSVIRQARSAGHWGVAFAATDQLAHDLNLPRHGFIRTPYHFKVIWKWVDQDGPRVPMESLASDWLDADTV